ncbi:apolipoprotein N-acyltransferase [Leucobacter aridicollis]|uniref:apolipoprotein N-acyltransferase n=1 Tax=Leucobacter aridicollis TaxID=283878 RepID=UPI002106DBF8|nr:apolipoprotein N-acyltransferase [Leucobacter aridicollis]
MTDTSVNQQPGRLPWWIALPAAVVGGLLFDVANPGAAIWPLVFPAVALLLASWWQQRAGVAALAGLAAGAAFWLTHLHWLTLYLGPVPWLGLGLVMTAWFVLQGTVTGAVTRAIWKLWPWRGATQGKRRLAPLGLIAGQAVAAAGIWVLREGIQGTWPYGGFPWGRVAHVFADASFGALVSWVGFAGLSGLMVFAVALVVGGCFGAGHGARLFGASFSHRARSVAASGGLLAGGVVLVLGMLALVPPAALEQTGSLRVAAVQGNSKSGIFDDRESGDVYADHVRGTEELLDELEATDDRVDVILWPENSAEFGLTDNPLRGREVALLSKRAGAPIVVGSVLANEDGTYTNSSVVWGAEGQSESDAGTRYDKRFPVPFAEYMPNRSFFRALAPDLVDLVQLEYEAGEFEPVHGFEALGREVVAGVAICFDIIFDDQAERMVSNGAEVIFAPTNNADFGRTDESVQQLQIARLRAIETGRALVNISTVGTSRIIAPDGHDLDGLLPFTRGAMVATVPLVQGETPALAYGALIAAAWMTAGLAGMGLSVYCRLRRG